MSKRVKRPTGEHILEDNHRALEGVDGALEAQGCSIFATIAAMQALGLKWHEKMYHKFLDTKLLEPIHV